MEIITTWGLGIGLFLCGVAATIWWGNGSQRLAKVVTLIGVVFVVGAALAQFAQVYFANTEDNRPRPFMGMDTAHVEPIRVGQPFDSAIHLVNTGQEPAINLRAFAYVRNLDRNTEPSVPAIPRDTASTIVVPTKGITVSLKSYDAVTDEEKRDIESGLQVVWALGNVQYGDRYGRTYALPIKLRYKPRAQTFGPG